MKNKRIKKNNKQIFYKSISILLVIVSIIFLGVLFYIDLLPAKYMTILVLIVLVFNLINVALLNIKRLKRKIKKFISIIVIIVMLIMIIATFYICKTLGVLFNNGDSKYKLEHYSVVVLKNSGYKSLDDIKNKTIGYYENSAGTTESKKYLDKKVIVKYHSYSASNSLLSSLLDSEVEAILVEDSIKKIMEEESNELSKSIKVIYTFTIKVKVESTLKDVNVTKNPFAVYISGIDTYGEISSVSRSDVNMVMVVNPKTKQVLLISIPRDYYVQLHGTTGIKDKLTHAGIYGVDMSIHTIEDLLNLKINYYLKVNFTSVIDIVDALGGLEVYSDYTFISYSNFSFKKGYNQVNGEQALDFVRTRKAFATGDRQRGKNQQALIEAIIRKATNKSVITKYNSLLGAIDGKYQTDMNPKKITSLIKMQLNDMSPWNVTSYSLTGSDSSNYTYTYNQLLYVMEPDIDSINEVKELINKILGSESLESSYGEADGNTNKVNSIKSNKSTSITQKKQTTPLKESEKKEKSDNKIIDKSENNSIDSNIVEKEEIDKIVTNSETDGKNDDLNDSLVEENQFDEDEEIINKDLLTT